MSSPDRHHRAQRLTPTPGPSRLRHRRPLHPHGRRELAHGRGTRVQPREDSEPARCRQRLHCVSRRRRPARAPARPRHPRCRRRWSCPVRCSKIEPLPARNAGGYREATARVGAQHQVRAERLAFRRKRAWTMNTAPTAMTSQSQTLKPSSTPSATVRAMIKVKAATVAQFLTRECDLATSSFPSVDPVGGCYSPRAGGGATTVVAREARRPTNRSEPSGRTSV
jgi:hypothetical protein